MGRHKEYDPTEALEGARKLFLERGFSATSVADLAEATGLNKKSLYAEFGSKQELFESALLRHRQENNVRVVGPMETESAGLAEIRSALERWGRSGRGAAAGLGCLLCNTASERSAQDPAARKHVRAYLRRMTAAFRNALQRAADRGELVDGVDIDAEAGFLASHAMGQLTLIRSKAMPELVEPAARVALAHLDALEAGPP